MDSEELQGIVSEQSREVTAAIAVDSDLHFAFQLQMQEAMNASVALHQPSSSSSSSSTPPQFQLPDGDVSDPSFASLVAEEIARFERERNDREVAEAEMRRMRDDFDRLIHDQVFARDVSRIADAEWAITGDNFVRPYGEGSSSSSAAAAVVSTGEPLRLYFKGLVREERVRGGVGGTIGGTGIAICDFTDGLVFEMRKSLVGDGEMSVEVAEVKALLLGLDVAISLGIKRIAIFCGDDSLYQYVTGKSMPRQGNIATLVGQVTLLQRKFSYCSPFLVRQDDIKFAVKLANEALVSQVTQQEESTLGKYMKETCPICFEEADVGMMFSVDGCLHRYCASCMKKHVEMKLLQGMLPRCPYDSCKSELKIESCKIFLTTELHYMMSQHIKESSIPLTEKIYCPYPRCSALMSKVEVLENTYRGGSSKCKRCLGLFCMNCKVPWHNNMSCHAYKYSNPFPSAEDAKLKSLATKNLWRQCVKCNHMVELAQGCNHIYCRCGYEFCYLCGAEWKNKKATCTCPLWDERRIVYDERNRQEQRW